MNRFRARGALSAVALIGVLGGLAGLGRMRYPHARGLPVGEGAVRGAELRRDG